MRVYFDFKRVAALLSALCLLFSATACAASGENLTVTATFYPLYVAAINIARDVPGVTVACMAPPGAGCLHDYQMTTADRRHLQDSDVIIQNGAGLEGFLDALLPTLPGRVIDASAGIALLPDEHEGVNPHVWVSVDGMMGEVRNIALGLAEADPAHAEQYAQNAGEYLSRLAALRQEMAETLAPVAGQPIVTFHEAFDYFAEAFDLMPVATVSGGHDVAPSARQLAALAETVRTDDVRALFAEPQYDDESVNILSRETGVPVYILDPAVSGEVDPTDYDAYIRVMRRNAATLLEALQ